MKTKRGEKNNGIKKQRPNKFRKDATEDFAEGRTEKKKIGRG